MEGKLTISKRMHVRDDSEVCTIGGFQKQCHARHESKHGSLSLGIDKTNNKLEDTRTDTKEYEPEFLSPDGVGIFVYSIRNETTYRAEKNVQKTKHGRPLAGCGLTQFREVLQVVGTENRIDRKLSTEGAGVGEGDAHGG